MWLRSDIYMKVKSDDGNLLKKMDDREGASKPSMTFYLRKS